MLLLRSNLSACEDLKREGKLSEAVAKRKHLAKIFREHGVAHHAQHHLEQAEALAVQSGDTSLIVDTRRQLGALFEQQGKLEESVRSYLSQLDVLEASATPDTQDRLTTAWRDLARTFLALAKKQAPVDGTAALQTVQSAERFAVKGGDQVQLVPIFLEAGAIHEQARIIPRAVDSNTKEDLLKLLDWSFNRQAL
ncbi:hypothetical protein PTSG_12728 [Salpingoeca rosetta]|uniref:Tetratricopeptide repeat protein 29 n=1 Tax=Salpingoeca rosetta (strain ATCC 50818 / BSB-021) TaxID=946362 RepID=F2UJQ9_SALR5|nr:uncharacterized protein PTSG_12728 [Salpingoeca rosetta]EGD77358.1 hypothetical protein PTSG_12728 [Salpingoeca rosetta]|eukprot:XP_004990702.1 hypothetical protein PTSG_12728 [Salpingoeca rosetta]